VQQTGIEARSVASRFAGGSERVMTSISYGGMTRHSGVFASVELPADNRFCLLNHAELLCEEVTMSAAVETPLNQFKVLRYDEGDGEDTGDPVLSPESGFDDPAGSADMAINGPGSVGSAYPITPTQPATGVQLTSQPAKPAAARPVVDQVDISPAGKMLDELNQSSEVRAERLAQIKSAIDAGTYDTPEKLEAALSKMLGQVESDLDSDR